jgi:hypothetical protein
MKADEEAKIRECSKDDEKDKIDIYRIIRRIEKTKEEKRIRFAG